MCVAHDSKNSRGVGVAATISCEATRVDGIFCTLWDSGTCPRILGLPNIQSFTGNPDLESS